MLTETHPSATQRLDDAVGRDGLAIIGSECYVEAIWESISDGVRASRFLGSML